MKYTLKGMIGIATMSSAFAAVSLSSHDQFTVDTQGWREGGPSPNAPTITTSNSWNNLPGYLNNTSTGNSGSGGKFVMFNNNAQWTGDYPGAEVTAISMWVDNRTGAGSTLPLAIAFNGSGGWFLSNPINILDVTAGVDEWQQVQFDLTSANFSQVSGFGTFADTMANVSRFEILLEDGINASAGSLVRGEQVAANLQFDDIQAIPEPASLLLALLGGSFAFLRRKR